MLGIDANVLYSNAGILPEADRKLVKRATPEKITEAWITFLRGRVPMGQGHPFSGADVSKHIGGALADGMNRGVGSAFNRSGILSVTECNALIRALVRNRAPR